MNLQRINLDVSKIADLPYVYVGQGDHNGTTIEAHIFDNGTALDLTGMQARFEMRLPMSSKYVRDFNCSVSGNVITYVVDEEHVAVMQGKSDSAYFSIVSGDTIASTNRFTIHVLRSAHDGAVPAESWDNAVDALIERGNELVEEMDESIGAYDAAEELRAQAEAQRVQNEEERVSAETARATAETARQSAESARATAEASRASAEQARVTAESGRVTADEARTTAQNANNAAQTANDTAQSQNDSSQQANTAEQAQNNLDQQRNNEAAASGYARYLASGEYDPETGKPTIDAETEMRMCIAPNPDQEDEDNRMLEWARRTDDGGETWRWELVGGTGWKPTPATTAQANTIWDDDTTVTSSNTPDVSWMSYYATKVRQWVTDHFVGINTIARVAQVVSSGEVQATVSDVVHRLSEKLNAADYRKALTWGEVKDSYTWGVLGTTQTTTGTTTTPNLGLTKPGNNATVDVADINGNSDIIDTQVQALRDVVTNAKSLLGQLGVDENGEPLVDAATARATLGAAADGGTSNITTLKAAETAITTLQDSVELDISGDWASIKLASISVRIAYGKLTFSNIDINIASTGYGGYRSNPCAKSIPSSWFSESPVAVAEKNDSMSYYLMGVEATTSQVNSIYFASHEALTSVNARVGIVLVGRC